MRVGGRGSGRSHICRGEEARSHLAHGGNAVPPPSGGCSGNGHQGLSAELGARVSSPKLTQSWRGATYSDFHLGKLVLATALGQMEAGDQPRGSWEGQRPGGAAGKEQACHQGHRGADWTRGVRGESRWVSNWGPGWTLSRKQAEDPLGRAHSRAELTASQSPGSCGRPCPLGLPCLGPPPPKGNQLLPPSWDNKR